MKALTFGSAMVDIIAVLETESIEQITLSNALQQFLLVEPGRKVEAGSISTHIGGGGLNTGVALARLGCEVSPVIKTGKDTHRDHIREHCEEHGLSTDAMLLDPVHSSGSAVMIASHDKNAAIFTHRGANTSLVKEDIAGIDATGVELVHAAPLSGDSSMMLQEIADLAVASGAFFSCNPGIRQITTRTNTILTAGKSMDLLAINTAEAAALVPCLSGLDGSLNWHEAKHDEPGFMAQSSRLCLQQFGETMCKHGPKNVLITDGGNGAYFINGTQMYHQPVIPVEVAGTAGAGDAFVSTLAWGLQSGHEPEKALKLAAHNASSVVSYINTTDGLLNKDDLLKRAN